jgi:hypothetical protein
MVFREPFRPNLIEVMADERWKRLAEQQGAYAKTVAEAMDLKLDMDKSRPRKLRRSSRSCRREKNAKAKRRFP